MLGVTRKLGFLCFVLRVNLGSIVASAASSSIGIGPQSGYQYDGASTSSSKFEWEINVTDFIEIRELPPGDPQGIFTLTTNYTMAHRNYDVELFKKDCRTAPSPQFPLIFDTSNFINDVNTTTNINDIYMQFIYNQSMIQDSDFWTTNITRGGDAEFCIRVNNYLDNSTDPFVYGVYFLEISYKIEVNTLTNFHTPIFIYRTGMSKGQVRYIDYEDEIEAYQCDDDFNKLLPPPQRTQGEVVSICVETVVFSKFEVHSIKDLSVIQENRVNSPTLLSIDYVTDYVDNLVSETTCRDTDTTEAICKTKFLLIGEFFDDDVPTTLNVEGVVRLEWYTEGRRLFKDVPLRRHIKHSRMNRSLMKNGRELVDDGGRFSVEVELTPKTESDAAFFHVSYILRTVALTLGMILGL